MAQVWPVQLQELLNESNFGIAFGNTLLRSDMDAGPQKVRRRFTKGIDVFSGSINLNEEQFEIFEDFFKTTLNGGALPFTYNHPITQAPVVFRFKSDPAIGSIGGGNFVASFEWEKLP